MLTDAEMHVLDLTAEVTNAFYDLPKRSSAIWSMDEFVRHMHCIQDMVIGARYLARLAARVFYGHRASEACRDRVTRRALARESKTLAPTMPRYGRRTLTRS